MRQRTKRFGALAVTAVLTAQLGAQPLAAADMTDAAEKHTESPIKHIIVIIGENRTFDNVYGTYVPRHGQTVSNLLSKGIIKNDGSPGPNKDLAKQYEVANIDPVSYFVSTTKLNSPGKTAFSPLPTPEISYAPPVAVTLAQFQKDPAPAFPPFDAGTFSLSQLHTASPALRLSDLYLLTTGATGFPNCQPDPTEPPFSCGGPDTRIANYATLPNTVFRITGPDLPYDTYTGDMVHRFFHMWQQSDCDVSTVTPSDPAGCKNDLYPYVGIARGDDSGSSSMGFYDVKAGDAPLFKWLADNYTISDNYHQPVMGGTGVQHTMIGTADALPWEAVNGFPSEPPAGQVADPTPSSATNDAYVNDKRWTKCADPSQPGIKPIQDYLASLPWRPDQTASNCETGRFYMINNLRPAYLSNGNLNVAEINAGTAAPPSSLRTIGDALNEKNISWAFFGGGFNAAARFDSGSTDPFDVMIGTGGDWYCDICNPFQYASSIMGDPSQRQAHIKDAIDFFDTLDDGSLPAVSYLKPDSFDDGHPAYSKLDVFEALVSRVLSKLDQHPDLRDKTAVFITFDEGGGYWDSGFFQPIDFFGDGPRIPLVVVSRYSTGGKVVHSYTDHASIVKFIERNWDLDPLTGRSRDNLPNPKHKHHAYIPDNMPAIGDLFDMFEFHGHDEVSQ